jgi:ketosteroid isomerase-like protein
MDEDVMSLARRGFEAWRRGDLPAIEAMLAPDVRWGWFEPGDWDCRSREDVMRRLRERFSEGFAGELVRIERLSEHSVLAIAHPSEVGGPEWPDEVATLIEFRGGKVARMHDYRSMAEARTVEGVG